MVLWLHGLIEWQPTTMKAMKQWNNEAIHPLSLSTLHSYTTSVKELFSV